MSKIVVTIQIDTPVDMSEWDGLSIREHVMDNIVLAAREYHQRCGFDYMMSKDKDKRIQAMNDEGKRISFAWADAIKEARVIWEPSHE